MMRHPRNLCLLALLSLLPSPALSQKLRADNVGSVRSEEVQFAPFAAFPKGAEIATIVGNPSQPGPYVVRVRLEDQVRLQPHIHPEDRIYTVISGIFYIGFGRSFDPAKLQAFGPGSVIVLPRNTPHFHWARSGTYVTQVSGTGPLGITYVDPEDDPRNQ
jgi:quercetin dioxygenase-like cupin family protein